MTSTRALLITIVGAAAAVGIAAAAAVPVVTIEAVSVIEGVLVTGALIAGAGYRAAAIVRPGEARWLVSVQAATLLVLAGFVWTRPGLAYGMPGLTRLFGPALVVAGAGAWLALRPTRLPALVDGVFGRCSAATATRLTVVLMLLAVPAAAAPVVRYWDTSGWMDSHTYDTFAFNIASGEKPAGASSYMPVYQYGLALVYWTVGHFFFVQQLVNVALALGAVAAMCLAAWTLFGSGAAIVAAGLFMVFAREFYYAVFFTQIESWYVPFVCVVLYAWARYDQRGGRRDLIWLAAAVALGLNTRNQGLFFFAAICAAPLLLSRLSWRRRVVDCAAIALLVTISLVPWTLRNYAVDGRLSPSAARTSYYLGVLNDRRVGFYGIRYWEGWQNVVDEYEARYPVAAERDRALLEAAWNNTVSDPAWLVQATGWRAAAFYGLLPDGLVNWSRIEATDWRDWPNYVRWRTTPLVLLPLSLLAVLAGPDRRKTFLLVAVLASVSIVLVSASSDARVSYPVLPLHVLLVAGLFAAGTSGNAPIAAPARPSPADRPASPVRYAVGFAALAALLVGSHVSIGSRFLNRSFTERTVRVEPAVSIDAGLPLLNRSYETRGQTASPEIELAAGQRVRVRGMLSNYQCPPAFAGAVPWVPTFVTDPHGDRFYYTFLLGEGERPAIQVLAGVTFAGAQADAPLHERDVVEIEATILAVETNGPAVQVWLRAVRVRRFPASIHPPAYVTSGRTPLA